ncbi:unnamed protein product [Bemisia tabaci]|uniref:LITAF domain-containing protein n=1 Tax=Bemisia tabaci TaxID=7038 RepID=A0A9P0A0E4_BEMTA|nr:PREDICTED: lipopolysaccharide-induced tumor necrosis factor-alpha factor homolog [Bemisia tabaci]CAH0383601.1 unnamed protein product [Bemisia tabaci]
MGETSNQPGPSGPPPAAPPSYWQAVGGVPPPGLYNDPSKMSSTIVTTVVPLGTSSTHMICPNCRIEIDTVTRTQPGMIAYISSAIISLFGCVWGCCLIPCCIDECMDVHHSCPNCQTYLGRFRR